MLELLNDSDLLAQLVNERLFLVDPTHVYQFDGELAALFVLRRLHLRAEAHAQGLSQRISINGRRHLLFIDNY